MAEDVFHPFEAAQRQRTLLLWVLRALFFLLIIAVSLLGLIRGEAQVGGEEHLLWALVFIAVALFVASIAVDVLTPNKKVSTLAGALLGTLAALLATVALSYIIDLAIQSWVSEKEFENMAGFMVTMKIMIGIALCYLGISTVLQTQDDFRLAIPYVEFSKQLRGTRPLLLDTSALIDSRIVDVSETGIIQAPLVIPYFVVAELQLLADSRDKMIRSRGRRGLDVITRLQRVAGLDVSIDDTKVPGKAVDAMLVELAQRMSGRIVTTDSALARVARIQDVLVLNLHDLANALKPALVPGERLRIHVIRVGEQPSQGVGYLDDGTMVVVEGAAEWLGRDVETEVTSTLQTSAGRMIFGKHLSEQSAQMPVAAEGSIAAAESAEVEPGVAEALQAEMAQEADEPEGPEDDDDADANGSMERLGPFPPRKGRPNRRRNPRR